jgi:hypothetical protein
MIAHENRYLDPLPPPGSVYRLTCDQYDAMVEHGIIGEDEPVWLFQGVIVWKGAPITHPDDPDIAEPDQGDQLGADPGDGGH